MCVFVSDLKKQKEKLRNTVPKELSPPPLSPVSPPSVPRLSQTVCVSLALSLYASLSLFLRKAERMSVNFVNSPTG